VQEAVRKEEVQQPELTPEQIEAQMFEEAAALAGYTDEGLIDRKDAAEEEEQADPAEEAVAEDPEEETSGEARQTEAAPPDPFADATPEQRQAWQNLMQEKARFEHDSMSNRNRVSALQKKLNELEKRIEQQPQAAPPQPKEDADLAQDDAGEDLSEFQEDFPEIYKAVNSIYKQQVGKMQQQFESRLNQLSERFQSVAQPVEQMQQREVDTYRQNQLSALQAAHPDWQEIQASKDFWNWVDNQSEGIRALSGSVAAQDNIALLNLYKSQTQSQQAVSQQQDARPQQPKRQPDVALPRVNSGGRPRAGVPKNDADAAWEYWEKNWDKI
jgi:hypothetical protein